MPIILGAIDMNHPDGVSKWLHQRFTQKMLERMENTHGNEKGVEREENRAKSTGDGWPRGESENAP